MSRTNKRYGGGTKGSGTRARSGGVRRNPEGSGTWKRIGTRDGYPTIPGGEFIPELDEKAI